MIRFFSRLLAVLYVAARRLWSHRWLSLSSTWGFVVVIVFVLSVPLYADAVYYRVLAQQLGVVRDNGPRLPPFAFVMRYGVYWQTRDPWQDIRHADYFIDRQLPDLLRLPRTSLVRHFRTAAFSIYPSSGAQYGELKSPLMNASLTAVSDFSRHIRLVEGELPAGFQEPALNGIGQLRAGPPVTQAPALPDGRVPEAIPVLVSQPTAYRLGLQLGDRLDARLGMDESRAVRAPLVVAGVWVPVDPNEPYWFYKPYEMGSVLVVSEAAWTQQLAPRLGQRVAEVLWYSDYSGDSVRVWDVPALASQINTLIGWGKLPELNVSLLVSPLEALQRYQRDSQALMGQLYVFSIPLFVLTFAFIVLVAGLNTNDQRNEVAVLRSRGASVWQVMLLALAQALLLGAVAFAASVPASTLMVQSVGQTRSFLNFTGKDLLPVAVAPQDLPFGVIALAATVLIMVLPMLEAARHTVIAYKAERARSLRPPWWQRLWLDVLLLVPAAYWTNLLQRQGTLDVLGSQAGGDGPFGNPSLFLLPALSMLSLTLLFIRLLPFVLRFLSWLFSRLPGTALVLALRQLARSPGLYATPVLLLVSTLSLATFTASVAATLDTHLVQQKRYDVGAEVRLIQVGQETHPAAGDGWFAPSEDSSGQASSASSEISAAPRWLFLPVSDYEQAEGVQKSARVGSYTMVVNYSIGGMSGGRFMGVDTADFAQVAFWRADFAAQPLGALMNVLAARPDGVLVPETVLQKNALTIGDPVAVKISLPGTKSEIDMTFTIVGVFKLWPTWYPYKQGGGPVFVGNLDNLFEQAGIQMPYDVWLNLKDGADPQAVIARVRAIDRGEWKSEDVRSLLIEEQTRPQRQGLFGVLSLGFIASVMLTFVGFFLYALFTYRRRFIELGVLRAIGFSMRQMAALLASELALLLALGVGAGTALGRWASSLYIPFLQGAAADESRAVPFQIIFDWPKVNLIYGLLALLFVASLVALMIFLTRLRVFQAIKLGETE